jgi:hypothetical protein
MNDECAFYPQENTSSPDQAAVATLLAMHQHHQPRGRERA